MKAFLMHADSDFDLAADLPAQEQALTQDLELDTLLRAMAAGDALIYEVTKRALLLSLRDAGGDRLPPAGVDRVPRPSRGRARPVQPRR